VKTENEFLMARGQIAARITKLENELKYWREELAAFDRVETTMRKLNSESNGEVKKFKLVATVARQQPEPEAEAEKRAEEIQQFQSINLRKRGQIKKLVLKAVKGAGGKVSAKEVERLILKEGFKPNGRHFNITIYKTLNRLAEDEKIIRAEEGGNVFFHAKNK